MSKYTKQSRIETLDDLIAWLEGLAASDKTITTAGLISVLEHRNKSGDLPDKWKKCTKCSKILPAQEGYFDKRHDGVDGLSPTCSACRRAYHNAWKRNVRKAKKLLKDVSKIPSADASEINRMRVLQDKPPLPVMTPELPVTPAEPPETALSGVNNTSDLTLEEAQKLQQLGQESRGAAEDA